MNHHYPIAYTYEADCHCPDCTVDRFGPECEGIDSEGNEVHALFSWDEWYNVGYGNQELSCGTCGAIIDEYHEEEIAYESVPDYLKPLYDEKERE